MIDKKHNFFLKMRTIYKKIMYLCTLNSVEMGFKPFSHYFVYEQTLEKD
jgi:hypothetical protein